MSAGEAQLYFGGEIHTLEESRPSAEAVAVQGGRILAVGAQNECHAALAGDFAEIDLRGRVLLPGFIDTHLHPVMMAYFEMNADLSGVASIAELQARLRQAAGERSEAGWLARQLESAPKPGGWWACASATRGWRSQCFRRATTSTTSAGTGRSWSSGTTVIW
jgi:predicted amidohydrolase YtcJ